MIAGCVSVPAVLKIFLPNNPKDMSKKTIEAEVMDHQMFYQGNAPDLGWSAHDQESQRPDMMAMEAEDEVRELDRREVDRVRSSTMMRMFDHVLFDFPTNPDPAAVGRKILALAKFTGHKSVDGWSLGQIATACGETKAAMSARIRKVCNEPIERVGGIAQARFQQSPDQRAVSADAQMGNKNRAGKKN